MEYPVRTDVEFRSVSKTISQLSSLSRFVQIKISIPFTATGYSTILLNINPFHKFCRCFARISFIKLQRTRNTTVFELYRQRIVVLCHSNISSNLKTEFIWNFIRHKYESTIQIHFLLTTFHKPFQCKRLIFTVTTLTSEFNKIHSLRSQEHSATWNVWKAES